MVFKNMRSKISIKWLLFFVSIAGSVFLITGFIFLMPDLPGVNSQAKEPAVDNQLLQNTNQDVLIETNQVMVSSEKSISVLPIRLKIPKIGLDAAIESIGLTAQGAVDVPQDPGNAAWYNIGPFPGDVGSAVITGHFGRWKNGDDSVFDNLNKLSAGDSLSIEDENGVKTNFVVRELRLYDQNETVPEVFISNDGKAHLNLITCDGIWNSTSKTFSKRLVVFTNKE